MHKIVIVDFTTHAAHAEDFAAAITENATRSVAEEPGCHQFDVGRDPANPTAFFLYEVYENDAAFQDHLQSPHFKKFDALTLPWVTGKVARRLDRTVP